MIVSPKNLFLGAFLILLTPLVVAMIGFVMPVLAPIALLIVSFVVLPFYGFVYLYRRYFKQKIDTRVKEQAKEGTGFQSPNIDDLAGLVVVNEDFSNGNFKDADLSSSVFKNSSFKSANMKGADFAYAKLNAVDMRYSDLRGADLDSAELKNVKLKGAIADQETKLPFNEREADEYGIVFVA